MPPYPYYPQGIFVEDIKAPIQHRYDMSATHAHIDRAEAVNYTQRHPSMTVFLCSSPLHYSPLVYRLLSERERDGHGLQCILEGCFCTDYQLPRVAASFSFSPHSQLSPDPYSTPSAIGIHYCLQWQMHSINGIMLILCHCQPDTSDASPTLASNGGEADGACGYSSGHVPAGIS